MSPIFQVPKSFLGLLGLNKPEEPKEYTCCQCEQPITDHVYQVDRRRVRPLVEFKKGKEVFNPPDALQSWHAGIIVGPENDDYCPKCFELIPGVQELLNDYKTGLDSRSPKVGRHAV